MRAAECRNIEEVKLTELRCWLDVEYEGRNPSQSWETEYMMVPVSESEETEEKQVLEEKVRSLDPGQVVLGYFKGPEVSQS